VHWAGQLGVHACDVPLATHTACPQHAAAVTCAQDALPHALVQVWDRVGQAVRAAAGSRVLLLAVRGSARVAVAVAV